MSASTFFWKIREFEGFLGSGRTGAVVGYFERKRATENPARLVDLFDRELGGLHDGRRDDTIGTGKTDRNSDLDRTLGQCWRSQQGAQNKPGSTTKATARHDWTPFLHSLCSEEVGQYQPRLSCDPSISS